MIDVCIQFYMNIEYACKKIKIKCNVFVLQQIYNVYINMRELQPVSSYYYFIFVFLFIIIIILRMDFFYQFNFVINLQILCNFFYLFLLYIHFFKYLCMYVEMMMLIIIRNCCLQRNVETTVEQLYCVKYRHTLITFFPFPIQMPCFLLLCSAGAAAAATTTKCVLNMYEAHHTQ